MPDQFNFSPMVKPTDEMLQARKQQIYQMYPYARVFKIKTADPILKIRSHMDKLDELPEAITLVTPDHNDPGRDHLYIGCQPIARQHWSYNADTATLRFKQGSGNALIGGEFRLVKDRTSGYGLLQLGEASFSIEIHVQPVTYDIKIARGAAYVTGTSSAPQLKWDTSSDIWKNAQWSPYSMRFTYGIEEEGSIAGQTVYYVKCVYKDTDTVETWDAGYGNYTAYMTADFMLNFTLNMGITPLPDPSDPFRKFISRNFPYIMNIRMDPFAQSFCGAMLCEQRNLQGVVYGVQGAYDPSAVNGLYTLSHNNNPIGTLRHVIVVHNGKLTVDQEKVENSRQIGNRLEWDLLPPHIADKIGLPTSGYLEFSFDGSFVTGSSFGAQGFRISPEEAIALIQYLGHLPKTKEALLHAAGPAGNDGDLNFMDLINMDQFVKDEKGGWYDSIQEASMQDFFSILQYYMPAELRQQFVNPNPVELDPTVKGIAQMPGSQGTAASTWYNTLSTAYLTGLLSQWVNETDSKYLNGKRASKWIRKQTGLSDVFSVQGPLLYANRWNAKFQETLQFINDQKVNSAKYAALIDEDIVKWKDLIKNTVEATKEQMDDLMKNLDEIAAKGKAQNYWSYVVLRYCINAPFLNMLQVISFNPEGIDGSEFARRVQRTAAILNVLDPSSFFTQQFVYTIQLFQAANILPQLIDYSGDLSKYSYAINVVIQNFIKTYINSPDPEMQEAARAMQQMTEQKKTDDILMLLQQVTVSMGGLYNWGQLVSTFQSKAAILFGYLPKTAVTAVALAAVTFGVTAFATGQIEWKDLTEVQQATIISYGVGVFAQLVMLVVKRSVAVSAILGPGSGFGPGLRAFFSRDLMAAAQREATTGFRRWLLSEGGIPPAARGAEEFGIAAMFAREEALAAEQEMSRSIRFFFGRNMNEFIATRLGAIVAVCGLIMSAYFLTQSQGGMETAANALFVAASTLELIATAGAWIVGGTSLAITSVGGLLVGTIFPILGAVAVIAMVVGAVLMIIFMSKKPPSPVKTFAEGAAKNAGYYMPYASEIDNFEIYQPASGPQLAGVSLISSVPGMGALKMSVDGSATLGIIDHTAQTAFYLDVDESGRVSFVAPLENDKGDPSARYLTLDDSVSIKAAAPVTDAGKMTQQMWRAEMTGAPTLDENKHLFSAPFAFYNEYCFSQGEKKKLYLAAKNGLVVTDAAPQSWSVQMVASAPAGLRMKDLTLYEYNRDISQSPSLAMPGSSPRSWTITPALPAFLQIDPAAGTISQKTGVAPVLMPKTQYRLSVNNNVGTADTTFNIEVLAAPSPVIL